jgi:hypothetical protein
MCSAYFKHLITDSDYLQVDVGRGRADSGPTVLLEPFKRDQVNVDDIDIAYTRRSGSSFSPVERTGVVLGSFGAYWRLNLFKCSKGCVLRSRDLCQKFIMTAKQTTLTAVSGT